MKNMNDLFLHFLKDMYYAEQQALRTFPPDGGRRAEPGAQAGG